MERGWVLMQRFSMERSFAPPGTLGSLEIYLVPEVRMGGCPCILWVEALDAAEYPHGAEPPPNKNSRG